MSTTHTSNPPLRPRARQPTDDLRLGSLPRFDRTSTFPNSSTPKCNQKRSSALHAAPPRPREVPGLCPWYRPTSRPGSFPTLMSLFLLLCAFVSRAFRNVCILRNLSSLVTCPANHRPAIAKVEVLIWIVKNTALLCHIWTLRSTNEIFSWAATAHNEMVNNSGFSPDHFVLGRRMRLWTANSWYVVPLEEEAHKGTTNELTTQRRESCGPTTNAGRGKAIKGATGIHGGRSGACLAPSSQQDKDKLTVFKWLREASLPCWLISCGFARAGAESSASTAAPHQLRLVSDAERTMLQIKPTELNKVTDITKEGEIEVDEMGCPPPLPERWTATHGVS